jgi:hypothetical protein
VTEPVVKNNQVVAPDVKDHSASVVIMDSSRFVPLLVGIAILAGVAFGISIVGYQSTQEMARITERETRVMEDDLKFIRAYLNARGIEVPANHEEAEENQK